MADLVSCPGTTTVYTIAPMSVFEQTRLGNGIRVLTAPMPQVSSVACFVMLAAGSRYETPASKGIAHFVIGSAGKLAAGDIDKNSPLTARGFDTDYAFLVGEIVGDEMFFNAITRL